MYKKIFIYIITCLAILATLSCKKKSNSENPCGITDVTLFGVSKDIELGAQVDSAIKNTPSEYTIMDSVSYPLVYQELHKIKVNFLNSGKITHKDDFAWKIRVVRDDSTLNAFCTPGGYIYVYTGLIKYLPTLDALAGVMGHEMAHADKRHSTKSMTRQYGLSILEQLLLKGDSSQLLEIAKGLKSLQYSRCHESEADANSVEYLSNSASTNYQCDATARFFEKIASEGGSNVPEFLSTHPDPGNRVQAIKEKAQSIGCNTTTPSDPNGEKIRSIGATLN